MIDPHPSRRAHTPGPKGPRPNVRQWPAEAARFDELISAERPDWLRAFAFVRDMGMSLTVEDIPAEKRDAAIAFVREHCNVTLWGSVFQSAPNGARWWA